MCFFTRYPSQTRILKNCYNVFRKNQIVENYTHYFLFPENWRARSQSGREQNMAHEVRICGSCSAGRTQGPYKGYYESGEISETGRTVNDQYEDTVKGFYKNKQMMYLIPYRDGKKQGELIYFDENGNKTKAEHYKNDSLSKPD
jgi:antitoxin component YwqK of YwqJK toxin-antitoxin module